MPLHRATPEVISEALGHSSLAFTMDVYINIVEGMQIDLLALLDEVLPIGINGTKNNSYIAKLLLNPSELAPLQGNLTSCPCSSDNRAAVS